MRSRATDLCWRPREDHHACVHRPWYRLPHGPRSLPAPSYLQAPADKELCRLFNIHTNSPILGWPATSTSHAPRSRDLQRLFVPFQWAFQGHTKSKNHPTHPKRQLENRHDTQRYRKAYNVASNPGTTGGHLTTAVLHLSYNLLTYYQFQLRAIKHLPYLLWHTTMG